MCYSMIETSLVLPRKSSVISVNLQRFSKTVRKRLSGLWTTFWESSEIFGKSAKKWSLVCLYNKEYYIPACGYKFYLLVFNLISHSFAAHTHEILSRTLKDKIHIHTRACNILYITNKLACVCRCFSRKTSRQTGFSFKAPV